MKLATIKGQTITQNDDLSFSFIGGMQVDADGAARAYRADNMGLDDIRNAKDAKGGWCGVVAVNGKPVVQGFTDPAPGYYVSPTSLINPAYSITDPRRYVDAEKIPFVVVPGILAKTCKGRVLGCVVKVENIKTGKVVAGVCADIGPSGKLGEVSIKLAELHGVPASPRTGGTSEQIFRYTFFPEAVAPGYRLQSLG